MQRLQFVLFQADEAAKLLRAASLPSLRTALLLLDNCIELLLDRWIEDRLGHEELQRKIQARAIEAGIPKDHPHFADLLAQTFLTSAEASRVARFFDEKLRYASEKRGGLASDVAAVLSHIHRYRNESYHGGRVRLGILRTTVAIQLHLVCDVARTLKPGSAGYTSGEDFTWLKERFGLDPSGLWNEETLNQVLAEIRSAAQLSAEAVRTVLAENLDERIQALDQTIDFITTETRLEKTPTAALTAAQSYALKKLTQEVPYPPPPRGIDRPFDGTEIDGVRSVPGLLFDTPADINSFTVFAAADASLDRIEYVLDQFAAAIDSEIQLQIDLARGK